MYGQNLLGRRCVKSDELPDAANAGDLSVQWDNAVAAASLLARLGLHAARARCL